MAFNLLLTAAIVGILSAIVTLLVTPPIINRMHMRKLTGKDLNKIEKPEVAELGGIGIIFGFSFGMTFAIFLHTYAETLPLNLTVFLGAFITIVLVGFIGIVDDIIGWRKGIRQWQHALFPLFAALPLMAVKVGVTTMNFPFIGNVSLGVFYSLVLIPIGITGAVNAFNMLAGMNGLEAGMGIIISSTLILVAFVNGQVETVILLAAMLGTLVAFMRFNWFPAKIFPGDSATLMVGALIATSSIIGNMEKVGIMLMAVYFVELGFKAKHRFQSHCYGIPQVDGTLKPRPEGGSLTQWVMKRGSFTEKQVVGIILGIQLAVSVVVFLLSYYKMII